MSKRRAHHPEEEKSDPVVQAVKEVSRVNSNLKNSKDAAKSPKSVDTQGG